MGIWWDRRNADLRYVLTSWQYDKYVALSHFYRPVAWKAGRWTFAVYLQSLLIADCQSRSKNQMPQSRSIAQNPLTVRVLVTSLTFINYHNNWCNGTNNRGIMCTFALGFK